MYEVMQAHQHASWLFHVQHKILAACPALQSLKEVVNVWTHMPDMLCYLGKLDVLYCKANVRLAVWLHRLQPMQQASSCCLS